jgi:hypothetical protein
VHSVPRLTRNRIRRGYHTMRIVSFLCSKVRPVITISLPIGMAILVDTKATPSQILGFSRQLLPKKRSRVTSSNTSRAIQSFPSLRTTTHKFYWTGIETSLIERLIERSLRLMLASEEYWDHIWQFLISDPLTCPIIQLITLIRHLDRPLLL